MNYQTFQYPDLIDNSELWENIPASNLQWDGASAEQLNFMRRVYERQVARAARVRPFVNDVSATELMVIEGNQRARRAAAQACRDLLAAARADLAQQQQNQIQQALSVERIYIVSAYRSASEQFTNWQHNFPRYYQQSANRRAALSSGEHGEEAVNLLASHISGILAAPGYSLHNNGLAVDFGTRDSGHNLGANKNPTSIQRWQRSWLFNWLQSNAAGYNYYQNTSINEPWHWEYRITNQQTQQAASEINTISDSDVFYQSLLEPAPIADQRFDERLFEEQDFPVEDEPVHTVLNANAIIRSGSPQWQSQNRRIPRYTRVVIQERQGNYARVNGVDGTVYGWTAASNLGTYFKDLPTLQTPPLAPSTQLNILANFTSLKRALADTYNRLGGLMNILATQLNIQLPAILAVWYVESGGRSHVPNQAIIRFENHLLFDRWGQSNQTIYNQHFQHGGNNGIVGRRWQNHKFRENATDTFQSFHGNQVLEYQVLALASRLAGEEIALQCISIGGPQILGSNYRMIGYSTPREMYDAFQSGERPQVLGFFDFCQYKLGYGRNRGQLIRHLAALNWESFARGYNGTGQVETYSENLRQAYQAAVEILPVTSAVSQSFDESFSLQESVVISAGREELTNVRFLREHRGTSPDLILRWNDMKNPTSVDIVVHFHGYSSDRERMVISRTKEPYSGLVDPSDPSDLSLNSNFPTLAILPRGNYFGGSSGNGYDFPALITPTGLRELIDFCVEHFARGSGISNLRVRRMTITAHSGGGAAVLRILLHNDPHCVYMFDALYQDARNLIVWARNRIRRDQAALEAPVSQNVQQYMQENGGALRVFYRGGTRTEAYSLAVHRALVTALPRVPSPASLLSDWYRVERTTVAHGDIPRRYGFLLLGNPATVLPNTFAP
ncbi:MAG: DUF3380 domain-containing protein [Calothrix sp. C42_A2020_038]|nr:DUF3380 domain-containing protein [Calothrix sp. C42_A2020_038]